MAATKAATARLAPWSGGGAWNRGAAADRAGQDHTPAAVADGATGAAGEGGPRAQRARRSSGEGRTRGAHGSRGARGCRGSGRRALLLEVGAAGARRGVEGGSAQDGHGGEGRQQRHGKQRSR
ncbi:uncharacterized PE-PGRS family protein PE_PGRS54-like [Panicum virgatum]|uniref:uncharacterized PE-PGRS family protein PE_PGRS54-like n=1 Tax=Panicum virgatum TaxID=38727 RepID=UPI0019D5237D|nr:uncharacterized PE-PGRS family protein PE_PGRS54-like [Panicum virgatum]